jgi:thermostable 8-oxoguanine DNA glycosylase
MSGHLEVVKYFIFDLNLIISNTTLEFLYSNNYIETINIINSKKTYLELENNLNNLKVTQSIPQLKTKI